MGKGHRPTPPDPNATAGAQFAGNIASGAGSAVMSHTNQITPYGNLTYAQSGTQTITDPYTGRQINIPQYTATQTLSPQEQALYNQSAGTRQTLGNIASQYAG